MKIIIIGGGFAGCQAAIQARKMGAEVHIIERTDMLLGVGNVGGIMRNNGRFTAAEELLFLGANELIDIMDSLALHQNIEFSGHKHANLTDIAKAEPEIRRYILSLGINIHFKSRAINVSLENNSITRIKLADGSFIDGDVFIETTGSTGSMTNCNRYGNGCSMCILRCPSFGSRESLSAKAGIKDIIGERSNGTPGAMSGSCELPRESFSEDIIEKLDKYGVVTLPVPKEDVNLDKLSQKVCQQYALKEFAENVILLDTGHIKLMTSYYPLDKLRKIPGLENARYIDPLSGGNSNSIRYLASSPRDNSMKILGLNNMFCAGEKSGFFVGHTEVMATGALAGYNAVKYALNKPLLILPRNLAIGDIIAFANDALDMENGKSLRHTFSGGKYFERMKKLNLYTTDKNLIYERVKSLSLLNIFNK
ncbi:FAD-dependent oxidoreductase [Clostridium tertium]|uniref:FAD-dependent oxidoreductase n=1 Tax=Clostridium tertium TaxID=1559 RepID=UPI00189F1B3D|nr:FAD-dependent oxidoreductase [Clostridium tertium]MDB1941706.1 FAD-dependent oxidoreductase [Clostridium tertium]MDB1947178.1 FAD-dependent oxidoreductase [Clostridium tertium]MDB1953987.1 FAD-dependent oxidoreductase [Clostridium tertium]MDB1958315.1 FAD-dependent oxidoreductase [Clostridium tertium]MDB1960652.1 FAD-dependent oxidoreductase [Clostridium tertium]